MRGVVPCTNMPMVGEQTVPETQRRHPPRRSDVFELAVPDGRFGYGLVVEGGGVPYVAILTGI